ncbi:hypothetical protein RIF29_40860 [Crotalaria pallida]|uniref:tRNA (guanine(9)-N(1))-methyltransferase n=1 Tax=Crotalaria pallida TaxID=3830 RepID=A0AAN9HUP3_CROPI
MFTFDDASSLLRGQFELPWLLRGDFNEILWSGEKEGGARKDQGLINRFREALDDCGLEDVGVKGNPFTWSRRNRNGQPVRERLDRFVANQTWKNMTQNCLVSHLSAPVSDHFPILMYFEFIQQRRRLKGRADRFFFETLWAGYENCESIIAATWNSDNSASSLNVVVGKLHLTGLKLVDWSKKEIPNIPKELKRLQLELDKSEHEVSLIQALAVTMPEPHTTENGVVKEEQQQEPQNDEKAPENPPPPPPHPPSLSKNAQKKLLKQQRYEAKKAEKKALAKEQKKIDAERKRKEWEEKLANVSEEEREKLLESRKNLRKERMEQRNEEKEKKRERLLKAKEFGQNVVVDLEFSHLMTPNEIHSLVQQIMYCYAVNGRCCSPAHLWLTGCDGEMGDQLQRIPGFDKWIIEKQNESYIQALQDRKENLVYLTADSENVVEELDLNKIYIIGGLVDRNRWKGITMKKAEEQGIQTAKLPIGNFIQMSSSQVLTVNQVFEILVKFLETRDWKTSFFAVIPQRKRCQADSEEGNADDTLNKENEQKDDQMASKKACVENEVPCNSLDT